MEAIPPKSSSTTSAFLGSLDRSQPGGSKDASWKCLNTAASFIDVLPGQYVGLNWASFLAEPCISRASCFACLILTKRSTCLNELEIVVYGQILDDILSQKRNPRQAGQRLEIEKLKDREKKFCREKIQLA
ncbi:hypothetical protein HG530_002086 [Fusarium avenaceum]|nr:hypothetical protein HG530_002086 [Fusarium avenaceum]